MSADFRLFDRHELLPDAWHALAGNGSIYTFNPGLVADGNGWILAYRVVLPDGIRRIAACRVSRSFDLIPDSGVPLSDLIRFPSGSTHSPQARTWFADPRLYRMAGRLFVQWNSGWHEPFNHQFLQELDPSTLHPLGHPREMLLAGQRQPIEKNWMLWGDGPFFATYSPSPHRVLSFDLEQEGDITFEPGSHSEWKNRLYERRHGRLRGSAPPQLRDGLYFSLCHSMTGTPTEGCDYHAAVYAFEGTAPHRPVYMPHRPLELPPAPPRQTPPLNRAVARVIYPCGLARDGDDWIVSYGMNDELCAIARLSHASVLGGLVPVGSA